MGPWGRTVSCGRFDPGAGLSRKKRGLRAAFQVELEQSGLSTARAADQIGRHASSITRWLNGAYADDKDAVAAGVERWLDTAGSSIGRRCRDTACRSCIAAAIAASQLEEDILEAHAIETVGEVLGGGNPESSAGSGDGRWRFAALSGFRRDVWRQPNLFERVTNAIVKICEDPMAPRGNTIKRLTGDMQGYWCCSARWNDADRRDNILIELQSEGSALDA